MKILFRMSRDVRNRCAIDLIYASGTGFAQRRKPLTLSGKLQERLRDLFPVEDKNEETNKND